MRSICTNDKNSFLPHNWSQKTSYILKIIHDSLIPRTIANSWKQTELEIFMHLKQVGMGNSDILEGVKIANRLLTIESNVNVKKSK